LARRSLPAEAERAMRPRAAAVEKAQGTVGESVEVDGYGKVSDQFSTRRFKAATYSA
jgi:hypothetical protein